MASDLPVNRRNDDAEMDEMENLSLIRDSSYEGFPYNLVEDTASGLSKLFGVDSSFQLSDLEEVVDNLLLYSGECCSVTDQMREESNKLLFIAMPQFYEKRAGMQKLFNQIDALEDFITEIKSNVEEMEQSVMLAEKQLGSNNFKKIISSIPIPSFFSQRKQPQNLANTDMKKSEPEIPSIFKTDNFLTCDRDCAESGKDSLNRQISES